MTMINSTIIVADDLTGANDTALQYFKNGYSAKVIIDCSGEFKDSDDVDIWAISTESRNIPKEEAVDRVVYVANRLKEHLGIENYYKKIDSTLRGNVGVEIVTLLEMLKKDAVVIAPAYIEENRTTIGSYQLLNGIPIERTQCALDPKAPIHESYIPNIIGKDLSDKYIEFIDRIDFKTIAKGAGPITLKLNELIQKGKKIIIADAVSNTDLEQIVLAINKSSYDILPSGSAGLANAFNKETNLDENDTKELIIPKLPKLIISGSATQLCANQIQKLKEENKDIFFVNITIKDVVEDVKEETINLICEKLNSFKNVVVHSSDIKKEIHNEEADDILIDAGIAKVDLANKITDFLADLTKKVNEKSQFILILVGGETSYKCLDSINSTHLEIMDAIMPAIPLCRDINNKFIVTKSGNFGSMNTIVDIMNYFDRQK